MEQLIILIILGVISGFLHTAGYGLYIRMSFTQKIKPHPLTWVMFAYGTLLLTVLEWDQSAHWTLLILPVVCTTLAFFVAFLCWKRGTLREPKDKWDIVAFIADLVLTFMYVSAGLSLYLDLISEETKNAATIIFLVGSNATTLTAFWPTLRGTKKDPHQEHAAPWIIWTCAYIVLGIATLIEAGPWSVLMVYPLMGAVLHGAVAWLSRSSRQAKFPKTL